MASSSNKQLDLANDSLYKLFFNYFTPMLLAMLAMASYSTVDGIFVSKKLGDEAMKSIVAVWPLFPFLMACSLMFGLGASSLIGYYLAKEKKHIASAIFSTMIYAILPISIVIGIGIFIFADSIVSIFVKDLSSGVKAMSADYLRGIGVGLFGMLIHPILDICIINDKRPRFAMFAMFVGAISNVVLNYYFLFIWEFGIIGSAYATVLGHIIGSIILLWHYIPRDSMKARLESYFGNRQNGLISICKFALTKKGELQFVPHFRPTYIWRACKLGSPYAASEISVAFIMWLYNRTLKDVGGEDALAIYSATLYVGFGFFTVLIALAESIQPLASFNYGLRNFSRLKSLIRFYITAELIISISMYAIFLTFQNEIASAFLQSSILREKSVEAMDIYFIGFIPLGISIIIAFYLQSLQRAFSSFLVTISYTLLFVTTLLPVFAYFYGEIGAYIAYPISQILALIVALSILFYQMNKGLLSSKKMAKNATI